MNKKLKVISLFAGAGGMDIGFINAGFDIVWANDFNADAVNTYKKNIGEHIVLGDITKIPSSQMPDEVDVVIGGFPCQGFSIANKNRSMKDERNFLYKELLRVIEDKKPKFFLAENVKGLLSMEKGKVIEMIKNDFENIGYKVDWKVLNAAQHGVPQARERVFIMGNRIGVENTFPEVTHKNANNKEFNPMFHKPQISVSEAIGHLSTVPLRDKSFILGEEKIHNHVAATNVHDKFFARKHDVTQAEICDYLKTWRKKKNISVKKIDEHFGYKHTAGHWFRKDSSGSIPKPHDWWGLKKLLGFDDTYDKKVTELIEKDITFEQSLRISNWDTPSDTITATSPEIHINKERRLSVRECAILQTFPMKHEFTGSLSSQYRQVGNAVPSLLAEKIAEQIKFQLK